MYNKMDPADKNYVRAITYENGQDTVMAYTAFWCKNCIKIKESFPDIFKDYKITKEEYISKAVFKKDINLLIPFFIKNDKKGIQTSKMEELVEYLEL